MANSIAALLSPADDERDQARSRDGGKHRASERSAADRDDLRFLDERGDGFSRLLGSGTSGLTEQGHEVSDRLAGDTRA
jgi:hypothetical protein